MAVSFALGRLLDREPIHQIQRGRGFHPVDRRNVSKYARRALSSVPNRMQREHYAALARRCSRCGRRRICRMLPPLSPAHEAENCCAKLREGGAALPLACYQLRCQFVLSASRSRLRPERPEAVLANILKDAGAGHKMPQQLATALRPVCCEVAAEIPSENGASLAALEEGMAVLYGILARKGA